MLKSMAVGRAEYLNNFRGKEGAITSHLVKLLCISDVFNQSHWVKEINAMFEDIYKKNCKVKIDKDTLKSLVSYDVSDGTEWVTLSFYCNDFANVKKIAYIYESGLKPCALIPDIMDEFISCIVKKNYLPVEKLPSFKKALSKRSIKYVWMVTLSQVNKLKNKIWQGGLK